MTGDTTPLVILGGSAAGLCIARRTAGRMRQIHIVGRAGDIGMRSKWGVKHSLTNSDQLETILREIRMAIGDRPAKAILTSDYFITALLERSPAAFGWFDWLGPREDLLRKYNDKVRFYAHAATRGMTVPTTVPLDEWGSPEFGSGPWIVKWAETDLEAELGKGHQKTWLCESSEELASIRSTLSAGSHGKLVVQTFLRDEDYEQLSYGAFFRAGNELASIVVRQSRQHPRGVSSFVEEIQGVDAELVRAFALELLRDEGYEGFVEVEVRRRRNGKELLLLDINPRPWGWVQALFAKYPNLPAAIDGGVIGSASPRKVRWVNPARDIPAIASQCVERRSLRPLYGALKAASLTTSVDLFDLSDPMPLVGGLSLLFKRALPKRSRV